MHNMKRFAQGAGLLAIITGLTACAGKPNVADGDFEYTQAQLNERLTIPETLSSVAQDQEYRVPELASEQGELGESVSIFPPRLIAPIVNASHIDVNDPRSTIWFEQTEQIDDLNQAIWNAIKGFLKKQDIKIAQFDQANEVLVTDWVIVDRETGWWMWQETHKIERQKFQFKVNMKPHGRSGSLTVKLLQREALNTNDPGFKLFNEQAIETEMVNSIVGHFEYRLRLDAENRRTQYVQGFSTESGTAPNGDKAFILNAPYEHAWIRMIDALDYYELVVTDLNKIQGRIYAAVKSDNTGFWASLTGAEDDTLGLKKGSYVIEIIRGGGKTAVVFNDITLEPIAEKQLEKVYRKLADRLAENLD